MDKFIIRLGVAPWDKDYLNFNPASYIFGSEEHTFFSDYIQIKDGKYILKLDIRKLKNINNLLDFNSVFIIGYHNEGGWRGYQKVSNAYYFIESIDTVNKGLCILTCIEDSLLNLYHFRNDTKVVLNKLGNKNLDFDNMLNMQTPMKDVVKESPIYYLSAWDSDTKTDFNMPYNLNNTANEYNSIDVAGKGFASHYSVYRYNLTSYRLYSEYYPFKDTLAPYWGSFKYITGDEERFSQTRGKTIVGVQKRFNNITLGFKLFDNFDYLSVYERRKMLSPKFLEVSAVIGAEEIDISEQLFSENKTYITDVWYDGENRGRGMLYFKLSNALYNNTVTSTDMRYYSFNLYPSDSVFLTVINSGDRGNYSSPIVLKKYRIPKSQQMYNKYQKYMIGNYFSIEQQKRENILSFMLKVTEVLLSYYSPIKTNVDIVGLARAGANSLSFFGGQEALKKDFASDFAVMLGGNQQELASTRDITDLGMYFKVKSYSKEVLETIFTKQSIQGIETYREMKLTDAINNNTYIQGNLKIETPTMNDTIAIEAIKRGINSFK